MSYRPPSCCSVHSSPTFEQPSTGPGTCETTSNVEMRGSCQRSARLQYRLWAAQYADIDHAVHLHLDGQTNAVQRRSLSPSLLADGCLASRSRFPCTVEPSSVAWDGRGRSISANASRDAALHAGPRAPARRVARRRRRPPTFTRVVLTAFPEYGYANTLDLPYHPPFDFELPDYVQAGRTLLGLAHALPYDEVPVSDFEVARLYSPTWDNIPLPEFESDDRFYLAQGIVRASPLESEAREPARESPARILDYARAARGGIALCSLNCSLGLGDVDMFQPQTRDADATRSCGASSAHAFLYIRD
ncbi:hypothetical protein HYPSUDRAFT_1068356 [Hypholoma sublateritium FD-334 SS-4]|uniref:Uncharacterized protein n=1 Tax=Hypholoma sublateritium (strain FD-334 SS-4) TaxID=945553 RepID=A0A0D2KLI3_HYPSF|nr:hypothetical protein HYPSUDRAFT_1068356 [Hypholoma sublateritium FD-334 SS-4]